MFQIESAGFSCRNFGSPLDGDGWGLSLGSQEDGDPPVVSKSIDLVGAWVTPPEFSQRAHLIMQS